MTSTVELPIWLFVLILLFAIVTAASHLLFPSVRWFFRRRMERVVAKVNDRLERPIEPFKLAQRHDMIQRLIYQPDVTKAVAEHAAQEGIPDAVAFEEAKRYAREIVPSFSATMYFGVAIRIARFLSRAFYRVRLTHVDEAALKDIPQDSTVVFVMNHKSNMDYVLVTYLAAQRSALSYAVGEWGRVWPLSRLIRGMGAYFIRRRSRNDLYRKVLAAYVRLATEAGVTQAIFPEGRLSLDGAPQDPKLGLLKYITDSYEPEGRDVVFVPVAINYDRVLEDRILLEAKARGGKGFRARISVIVGFFFKQLLFRLRGKVHRFGNATVRFGQPVSLRGFAHAVEGDVAKPLGVELMRRINAVVPILPVPLLAKVLEGAEEPMTRAQISETFEGLLAGLPENRAQFMRAAPQEVLESALQTLLGRRVLQESDGTFFVDPKQSDIVGFYANSIRHLLK
ncbi:1-acyl-sn-glycerol-3-phosphate acyltransferase [Shimia marina]|uniref:Glycerol-3-phosphate acyltransferase n=1 Tax=Shimia marina TaxID=321267 RepID=A0A0P1EV57_9RHOB|nr:1-acyl-sn-glycerol-3-phosphate acyltransferase [Shimia marina]CUH54311.1 Glycerol-3-phosphate acyltransferase [Shimia marina]SFE00181.1 glycerol-3-phosphate acyltransferase [Shimia marina]